MIRQLLLPDVKSEVDNIRSSDDAQNFVRRYGPAIMYHWYCPVWRRYTNTISVYTKTSTNNKEDATSMTLSLSAEVEVTNLNAAGGVSFGTRKSTEDNSFQYTMSAYGGNKILVSCSMATKVT